jgi:hypothetical protein
MLLVLDDFNDRVYGSVTGARPQDWRCLEEKDV